MLLALALALVPAAHAWGHHYLVTDRAMEIEEVAWATEEVVVEPLEAFLTDQAAALSALFDGYYQDLAAAGESRFLPQTFPAEAPTREAFLRAARLNPEAGFPLVLRVVPGGERHGFPVGPQAASPYLTAKPPLIVDVEVTVAGTKVPGVNVYSTFSDEPDWGFDHELWPHAEYGYGEQPYGRPTGESSKAPFHMQFDHEPFLVRKFASQFTEGMATERVDLFLRLSRLAFDSGHTYWGYRFAAWANHYVQDLCMPYHSRSVPSGNTAFYLKYLVSADKAGIEARTTQVSANRHFIYEDYVAFGLQQSYTSDEALYDGLAASLHVAPLTFQATTPEALVAVITEAAAEHAFAVDAALVDIFGPDTMDDPTYDLETDPDYRIDTALSTVDAERAALLLQQTGQDFAQTGRATRTLITLARGR